MLGDCPCTHRLYSSSINRAWRVLSTFVVITTLSRVRSSLSLLADICRHAARNINTGYVVLKLQQCTGRLYEHSTIY